MNIPLANLFRSLLLGLVAWQISGCSITKPSEASQFYLLSAPALSGSVQQTGAQTPLVVGPVGFADYLKRHALVTQRDRHTYDVAKLELWGGSLEEEFHVALYKNVQHLMPGRPVHLSAGVLAGSSDLRLKVEVYRFDFTSTGVARLEAEWGWFNGRNQPIVTGQFYQTQPTAASLEGNVQQLSALVALLAAEAIAHLPTE